MGDDDLTAALGKSTATANLQSASKFTKATHNDTYKAISPRDGDLSGRSVFITGASRGIGKATALSFAAAGCSKIGIGARSDLTGLEHEIKAAARGAGRQAVPKVVRVQVDVTSEASVAAAAATLEREFGGALDVLVNNAGYLEEWRWVGESRAEEWWRAWEINLRGCYLTNRALLPLLLRGERKTSVNVTSVGALLVSPGYSAYQASKVALTRFVEFLAEEYGDKGLTAIAAHPGSVLTDMGQQLPDHMRAMLVDTPELAADTFTWLSREARPWLSGRFMSVNWDVEELTSKKDEIVQGDKLKFRMVL